VQLFQQDQLLTGPERVSGQVYRKTVKLQPGFNHLQVVAVHEIAWQKFKDKHNNLRQLRQAREFEDWKDQESNHLELRVHYVTPNPPPPETPGAAGVPLRPNGEGAGPPQEIVRQAATRVASSRFRLTGTFQAKQALTEVSAEVKRFSLKSEPVRLPGVK